jgi:phosphopantothenoylcysteine decarboxylase/phosphopantothenate--cysteine ligase
MAACEAELPVDVAVCTAAVADWRPNVAANSKMKKRDNGTPPNIALTENPDILHTLAHHKKRPSLVIGFAAETDDLLANAAAKRTRKGADWIVANDVTPASGIMGGDRTRVHVLTAKDTEDWPEMAKAEMARRLVARIAATFGKSAA